MKSILAETVTALDGEAAVITYDSMVDIAEMFWGRYTETARQAGV